MSADQSFADYGLCLEVRRRQVDGAAFLQGVGEEERHGVVEADGAFFVVGKGGDLFVFYQVATVCQADVEQSRRAVADGGDNAAVVVDAGGDGVQRRAVRQVPHGGVAARVVDGGVVVGVDVGGGEGVFGLCAQGGVVPEGGVVGVAQVESVHVGFATFGAGEVDLVSGVAQDVVGVADF